MRNVCTRLLCKTRYKLGGYGKSFQINESHLFKIPKGHRRQLHPNHNWCFVAIEEESDLFYAQMVCKRTRPVL